MGTALRIDDFNAPAVTLQRHLPDQSLRNRSNSFQNFSPASVPSTWTEAEEVSQASSPRTLREQAPIHKLDRMEVQKRLCAALETDYGDLKSRNKEIADDADVSPKTVEAWTAGISLPGLIPALKLMAQSHQFAAAILELCALERDLDPKFQEAFANFMRMVGR